VSAQYPRPLPEAKHAFIVVAHRGNHEHVPENTLAAFENAIETGADYVEIDLRTTVDSQLVIMHDASVNRMTDSTGLIKDMTLDKLRHLKVKEKSHPEWGSFDIPLFREVLELCKNKIYIYLDFKNADPSVAYQEIVRAGMEKQVVVYINAEHQFYEWRKVAPLMPLMVSLPGNVKDTVSLRVFLDKVHPDILDGDFDQYTADMVKMAIGSGYAVLPDIQRPGENSSLWALAIQKGIRALQTNEPTALISYLQTQHLR
jgi:glycerophosphoryl diester phosphodiesterase